MGLADEGANVVRKTQGEGKALEIVARCKHLAGVSANYIDLREIPERPEWPRPFVICSPLRFSKLPHRLEIHLHISLPSERRF